MNARLGRYEIERGESALVLRNAQAFGFDLAPWVLIAMAAITVVVSMLLADFSIVVPLSLLGVASLCISLMYGERRGGYGVLPEVRRTIEMRETSGAYREGAHRTLHVDGANVDVARLRCITTRSTRTSRGLNLWRLYLVFDSFAYLVETTYDRPVLQELQQELERALEVRKGSDDGTPAPPDPQGYMVGFVFFGQLVATLFTMAPVIELRGVGWFGALAGPVAILVGTPIFAIAYGSAFRTRALRRLHDLFGIG